MLKKIGMLGAAVALTVAAGCTTYRDSNTARTPEEQLLLSKAVDYSLAGMTHAKLAGQKAFLDVSGLECVDKAYVVDALKQNLAASDVRLVDKADEAEFIITARAGTVATQAGSALFGIPALKIPIPMVGTTDSPEVALFKWVKQDGLAKLCVSAYSKDKKLIGSHEGIGHTRYGRWTLLIMIHWDNTNVPELKMPVTKN